MASENLRWRNIREFLDDLPTEHCQAKPDHEFCTVCLRINFLIAQDCPLYHQKPKRKRKAPPPPPEARPEPIKDHLSADDVVSAMKGEDFPIIEFAGPRGTGGHDKEEEIFEVKPLDVKPMAAPPPEALKKASKKEGRKEPAEPRTEAADAKPATAVADRDPESIVQEIMEELEFPEGEELEDEGEEPKDDVIEEEGPQEEGPETSDDEEGPTDEPPVVKKEAVKKRRPKK
jgi:hypothetical protein